MACDAVQDGSVDVKKLLARLARPKPFDVAREHLPEIEERCRAANVRLENVPRILRRYAHAVAVRQSLPSR
jgi:hypothetical protein